MLSCNQDSILSIAASVVTADLIAALTVILAAPSLSRVVEGT